MSVATRGMGVPGEDKKTQAVLIAGPTASGKSALALDFAQATGGGVINADSMQVYDTLRVLTARPSEEEIAGIPHYLYDHVPTSEVYSTGRWLRDVTALLSDPRLHGRVPVFVGGTGLYFKALLGGLSDMPVVPDAIRTRWRDRLSSEGPQALHVELSRCDAAVAKTLNPGDSQRIVRALEVFEASGRSILSFQNAPGNPLIDADTARKIVLLPDRSILCERIRHRFEWMMREGAVDEVRALRAQNLPPDLPAMKAIGVREISAFLDGELSREEANERAAIATRQYAKRQSTWFRNQLTEDWEIRSAVS